MTIFSSSSTIRTEIKAFLQLAIPLASAQVAQLATGFADTVMMGHLGREILAAGAIASMTFFALVVTGSGVVMGVSPLVAEAYGAGHKTRVSQIVSQGTWLMLFLTVPTTIFISHIDALMGQLGQAASTVTLANTYLGIMLWGFFPAIGFAMLRGVVSALAHAQPVMVIVIVGTLFNIAGNYMLGFGKLGFPRMELAGLAVASVLTLWGMFFALAAYVLTHKHLKPYKLVQNLHRFKPKLFWRLLRVGVPIGIFSALEIGSYTVITYLMGVLGTDALAAHQIVFQTINVIFMVPLGMSYATTARVGQWLGQKNLEGMRRAGYVSIGLSTGVMLTLAIALLIFSKPVMGLYVDIHNPHNASVLTVGMPMLIVAATAQIFDGIQKVAYGALQGLQDTRIPTLISFLSYWCIGLTSGYILGFHMGLDGTGLWIGTLISVAIAAITFVWRFYSLTSSQRMYTPS